MGPLCVYANKHTNLMQCKPKKRKIKVSDRPFLPKPKKLKNFYISIITTVTDEIQAPRKCNFEPKN